MYIKLSIYLFLYVACIVNDLDGVANPLLGPLEGVVGPENLDLYWAQMALTSLVAISRPIFQAHPFQWPSK
jgi:hypothetical protein